MATYPESAFPPGHRLAYHEDGSGFYRYSSDGVPSHPVVFDAVNNESTGGIQFFGTNNSSNNIMGVVLPVPVDVVGLYADPGGVLGAYTFRVEVSTDTTDLLDGTWATAVPNYSVPFSYSPSILTKYRNSIEQVDFSEVIGVRVNSSISSSGGAHSLWALHIYVAEQMGFLKLWHPTLDQPLGHDWFQWGTMYAGEADTREFRVKNIRGMTANAVSVDASALTNTSSVSHHTFSIGGGAYARPLNIGNLGAGNISPVITCRYAPPETATVTSYALTISAAAGSWT
jgi:hypothetical protein